MCAAIAVIAKANYVFITGAGSGALGAQRGATGFT
jgi:hypothetical protein